MKIEMSFSFKAFKRSIVQSLVVLPFCWVLDDAGYKSSDYKTWLWYILFAALLTISNKSFHNEMKEKQ